MVLTLTARLVAFMLCHVRFQKLTYFVISTQPSFCEWKIALGSCIRVCALFQQKLCNFLLSKLTSKVKRCASIFAFLLNVNAIFNKYSCRLVITPNYGAMKCIASKGIRIIDAFKSNVTVIGSLLNSIENHFYLWLHNHAIAVSVSQLSFPHPQMLSS